MNQKRKEERRKKIVKKCREEPVSRLRTFAV